MTEEQIRAAYQIGLRRSQAARRRGGRHRFGWQPSPKEQRHIDGMSAVSECYVAEMTGRKWTSQGIEPDRDGTDVSGGISVRWTKLGSGCLVVHEDEDPILQCVLVVNAKWPLRIAGWLHVIDAQQTEWWRTNVRYPAFFVPQRALRSIWELKR